MKITLKTLPQASARQVFNQVKEHLLKQGKKSRDVQDSYGGCLYRSGELCCAAGCLISDEEYLPRIEMVLWEDLVLQGFAPKEHKELICNLQVIHDTFPPERWEQQLNWLEKELKINH